MPGCRLHIKNSVLHLPQNIQILLKRILNLLQTPRDLGSSQPCEDRQRALVPLGVATELTLPFAYLLQVPASLDERVDLREDAAPVEQPLDLAEAVVGGCCSVVGLLPRLATLDTLV